MSGRRPVTHAEAVALNMAGAIVEAVWRVTLLGLLVRHAVRLWVGDDGGG